MLTGLKWSENKKGPKQEAAHERFRVLGFGKRTTYLTAGDAGKLLAIHVQVIDEYNLQPAQCLMSKRERLIRRSGAKASKRTGLVEMTSWLTKPQSKGTMQTMTRREGRDWSSGTFFLGTEVYCIVIVIEGSRVQTSVTGLPSSNEHAGKGAVQVDSS